MKKGFTLFEMMVSVGIFVLITTVGIVNYRKFGSDIFITNLAYDIALSARKAQSYGINVKESKATNLSSSFNYGYGLNFAIGPSVDRTTYYLYNDFYPFGNPNGKYDGAITENGSTTDEYVEKFKLLKRSVISKICRIPVGNNNEICNNSCDVTKLDITFFRPNPDARIVFTSGATTYGTSTNKAARVYIKTPDGREKRIDFYSIGQISVEDAGVPGIVMQVPCS